MYVRFDGRYALQALLPYLYVRVHDQSLADVVRVQREALQLERIFIQRAQQDADRVLRLLRDERRLYGLLDQQRYRLAELRAFSDLLA